MIAHREAGGKGGGDGTQRGWRGAGGREGVMVHRGKGGGDSTQRGKGVCACMRVYAIHRHADVHACTHMCIHVCACVYVCVCMHVCACVYVCVQVCLQVNMGGHIEHWCHIKKKVISTTGTASVSLSPPLPERDLYTWTEKMAPMSIFSPPFLFPPELIS